MKKWMYIAIIPVIILLVIIAADIVKQESMAIDDKDFVSVYYTGMYENGTVFDTNEGDAIPFTFQVGRGEVIPGFEKAVIGMKLGEEKTATVLPEDGYGSVEGHPLQNEILVFTVRVVDMEKFD